MLLTKPKKSIFSLAKIPSFAHEEHLHGEKQWTHTWLGKAGEGLKKDLEHHRWSGAARHRTSSSAFHCCTCFKINLCNITTRYLSDYRCVDRAQKVRQWVRPPENSCRYRLIKLLPNTYMVVLPTSLLPGANSICMSSINTEWCPQVPIKGGEAGKVVDSMWALQGFFVCDTCWGVRWEAWTGTLLYMCCPSVADAERCSAHRQCMLCERTPAGINDKVTENLINEICEFHAF